MTRGFLSSIVGIALVALLLVVTLVNVWQTNRVEHNQIEVLNRLSEVEKKVEAGVPMAGGAGVVARGPRGGMFGVPEPAVVTAANQDPKNRLFVDPIAWLPADAVQGGTLNLVMGQDPKGLNWLIENGADTSRVQELVHERLIRMSKKDPSKFSGRIAYAMYVDEDETRYTFKLRDDFRWHAPTVDYSSGRYDWLKGEHKVTANDVRFFMDMLMNDQVANAAPLRSYFENLVEYKVLDDYTFTIKFNKATFSQQMIMESIYPMPEFLYAYDEDGERYDDSILGQRLQEHWYNPRAIGCGPYRFVKFDSGVQIVLERSPEYPLGGNAFDTIRYQILKDQNSWPRKLRTKELDLAYIQPDQYRTEVVEGGPDSPFNNGDLSSGEYWTHSYFYIGWNADKPYFGDKRVRMAMSHAFNADLLLDEVFLGLGERVTGPMPSFSPFNDKTLAPIPFDLVKAAALLDEAGWIDSNEDGIRDRMIDGTVVEFKFSLMVYGSSNEYKVLGNIFKEDLAKIGVKMTVETMEWSNLLKRVNDREFDAVTLAWVSDPEVGFRQIWHSSQADIPKGSNRVGFRNKKADAIIEELELTFDHRRRIELAQEFHRLIYEEQPYTFFYTRKRTAYWQPDLGNVWFGKYRPYLNPRPWFKSGSKDMPAN